MKAPPGSPMTVNPGFGISANRLPVTVRPESLKTWSMKPAAFGLDHFHV